MTNFRFAFHSVTGRRIVEVYDERDKFIAGIYPDERGINVVSKYDIAVSKVDAPPLPPNGIKIRFGE